MNQKQKIKETTLSSRKSVVKGKSYFSSITVIPAFIVGYLRIKIKDKLSWKINSNGEVVIFSDKDEQTKD